jgi:hypothetical protein
MDALCGRAGFYHGSLEPDENHMPEDCKGCRKVLDGEAMEPDTGCIIGVRPTGRKIG